MKTIKIIDLLNKIANGEDVPKCIIYQGHYYYNVGNEEQAYYENTELDDNLFLYAIYNESHLNDEIAIIEDTPKEDKKIEKIKIRNTTDNGLYVCSYIEINGNTYYVQECEMEYQFAKKLNEIIDCLKSKGE